MQAKPAAFQIAGNALLPLLQLVGAVVEQGEVVHVAQIALGAQHLLAEVVQSIQVQIGEELAGEVADRQPAAAFERREQIVAGIVDQHGLLPIAAVDDAVGQCQGVFAGEAAAQVRFEDGVVDGREVAVDVAAQHMGMTVAEALVTGHGAVRAFADAVGVAVEHEAVLEDGLADGAEGVMHHAVAKRRGGDDAVLGVEDLDLLVAAGPVAAGLELAF